MACFSRHCPRRCPPFSSHSWECLRGRSPTTSPTSSTGGRLEKTSPNDTLGTRAGSGVLRSVMRCFANWQGHSGARIAASTTRNQSGAIREEDFLAICTLIDKFFSCGPTPLTFQHVDTAHPNLPRKVVIDLTRIRPVSIHATINESAAICATSPCRRLRDTHRTWRGINLRSAGHDGRSGQQHCSLGNSAFHALPF